MKSLLFFFSLFFLFISSFSQSPEGMSYQAILRGQDNKPLAQKTVGMRFSILQGTADGTAVYVEKQKLTTTGLGLITAEVGAGEVVSGDFSSIDWSAGPYFLKTEVAPEGGGDYQLTGTTQILSVPYALYARKAGNVFSGDYNDLSNAPVNVSAFTNDAGYLTTEQDGDPANEIQVLSISGDTLFLSNGGFVQLPPDGDFSRAGHFVTTLDSVGIGTGTPHGMLEVHGGIWQSGTGHSVYLGESTGRYDSTKSSNKDNVFIGYRSGLNNEEGSSNVAIGANTLRYHKRGLGNLALGASALYGDTTGEYNIAIGINALASASSKRNNIAIGTSALSISEGNNNIALGYAALRENLADGNIAIGGSSLFFNSTGHDNIALGTRALMRNTTGCYNLAIGKSALASNSVAFSNTALGYESMHANRSGFRNTATGYRSLYSNTSGAWNTATGYRSLASNTQGNYNTAFGYYALPGNTTGNNNTAVGNSALYFNSEGINNTATGSYALYKNTVGTQNTAVGDSALYNNLTASFNTAVGQEALCSNTSGEKNTAIGRASLHHNQLSSYNTALGEGALYYYNDGYNYGDNTAVGYSALWALKKGYENTAVGSYSGTFIGVYEFSNSTSLGYLAHNTASNQVRIGNGNVTSIGGYVGWSNLSDGRFKTEVKSSVPGLSFIMQLRPVMYRLDLDKLNKFLQIPEGMQSKTSAGDADRMVRTGFIAQEVEKVAQETGYDFSGIDPPKNEHDFYNLRYAEFVVPLVKAVQEQQAEIEALQEQNRLLQQQIDALKNK